MRKHPSQYARGLLVGQSDPDIALRCFYVEGRFDDAAVLLFLSFGLDGPVFHGGGKSTPAEALGTLLCP